MITTRLNVVIYIRVSDLSQVDNNSLETQLKACLAYAEANNFEVVQIFREEGKSAKHVHNRPELRKLLDFCTLKKNNISGVIVYKMDRWTRNVEEGLLAISLLAKSGVIVLPATEITEQNAMGKAMRTILMAMGELDNNLKGERVRDNMITMFKKGLWCWQPPIGYKRPFKTKEENKGKPPIIDEKIGEIIKLLFIKASKYKMSKKSLADYVNKLGFQEAYGKPADGRIISRIVSDTFYYGYMYGPKWKEYQWGKHEPTTDQVTWEKANFNLFGTNRKYKIQDNNIYPLKGLLLCINCDYPMTSSNPKGTSKNYLYYECHNSICSSRSRISVDVADTKFIQILNNIKPSERVLKLFTKMVFSDWEEVISESRKKATVLDDKINSLENKLIVIAESNAKNILTDDEARLQAEKTRNEISVLRIERSDIRMDQYDTEAVKNFTESFLLNVDKLWIRMELSQKQALQNLIFPEGLYANKEEIRIKRLASSFNLIATINNGNVDLVTPREFESRFSE